MFKKVEYTGFEGLSDLRAKAEQLTSMLNGIIRSWGDQVEVAWRPVTADQSDVLELSMALTLPDAVSTATGRIHKRAFAPGEESLLRIELREVWLDLLDRIIAQMAVRVEESFADPVEA